MLEKVLKMHILTSIPRSQDPASGMQIASEYLPSKRKIISWSF